MYKKYVYLCFFLSLVTILLTACSPTTPAKTFVPLATTPYPTEGTPYPVVLSALTPATHLHANLVYFMNAVNGNFANIRGTTGLLKRYDTDAQQAVTIASLANINIEEAQVSPDGQWVLFVAWITDHDELRIVRMDGQKMQTLLYSQPYGGFIDVQWSPDQRQVVFDQVPPETGPYVTYLLDMATGHLQQELVPRGPLLSYAPRKWLDNSHILLLNVLANSYANLSSENIYILDTSKGAQQHESDLQEVYTTPKSCMDVDSRGNQLYILTCIPHYPAGTTIIMVQPLQGGTARTLFTSTTVPFSGIRFIAPSTLLLLSDSALWRIQTDGTGLRQLAKLKGFEYFHQFCQFTQTAWANVSRDGKLIALQSIQGGVDTHGSSLYYSALSKGTLQQVDSSYTGYMVPNQDVLLVGWTTF